MTSSNNHCHWILFLKLLIISSAVFSVAVVLKVSVPLVANILVSDIPVVWSSIIYWLRPPYIYLLVNFIIISILAYSKLHQILVDPQPTVRLVVKLSTDSKTDDTVYRVVDDVLDRGACGANENSASAANVSEKHAAEVEVEREFKVLERENDENGERDLSGLQRKGSMELLFFKNEKNPTISSPVSHRKAAKATPTDKTLGGSKRKGHDTMDDTWKMITEGHLKKSNVSETRTGRDKSVDQNNPPETKKSETFVEGGGGGGGENSEWRQPPETVRVRGKGSVSGEDLNRRVEEFIEKFKEQMRLQREESLKKFRQMISRGAH